jgi:hypothetical protein
MALWFEIPLCHGLRAGTCGFRLSFSDRYSGSLLLIDSYERPRNFDGWVRNLGIKVAAAY